ncbi:Cysteine-rich receptor-like protein kinase 8 [Triticum urartu]|uniref:Cysteine-rich receptor-like protein kinase 8 n=1 Tax=Triticum urartu TaxID=4572 RepID=M8B5H6_TRIUA|nr:Cysteine-rich receptor-like protein kinase 8 [Triticum urartu]
MATGHRALANLTAVLLVPFFFAWLAAAQPQTDARNVSAPAAVFDNAVGVLLNATADYAASNSSKRFATGEEMFDTGGAPAIYALRGPERKGFSDPMAASNSSKRFATGEEMFDTGGAPAIYALVQCTPDLAPAACRSCLGDIIQKMPKYLSGGQSGRAFRIRCNYRYELYPFFSGSPLLRLSFGQRKRSAAKISASVACTIVLVLILSASAFICFKKRKPLKKQPAMAFHNAARGKCMIFDLSTLQEATENFSEENKLGEGGFGTVYKGTLPDEQEVAVKRLSQASREGLNQLHNEVQVLAQLQHIKLVRLLGYCSHQNEVMLVYEFVKNGCLHNFLFDERKGRELSWNRRYNIIIGIAKGILYLHEDSSIRIIHRDLKSNNILLDENMNPKIADFGLARLLGGGHTQTKTANVAGTYGYMAPEYAIFGNVSPKIDIFSFGVLILEIVTRRKNNSSDDFNNTVNLLSDVYNCWTKDMTLQIVDKSLNVYSKSEVLRCIHIGLLCIQEDPDDRPNISSVVLMLTRDRVKLQPPRQPAFFFARDSSSVFEHTRHGNYIYDKSDVIVEDNFSVNEVTNTDPYPR